MWDLSRRISEDESQAYAEIASSARALECQPILGFVRSCDHESAHTRRMPVFVIAIQNSVILSSYEGK